MTKTLHLLKSLRLLEQVPEPKLKDLAKFLESRSFQDGEVVFEESSPGDSLYFVSSGNIRILKKGLGVDGGTAFKELSILGPGDCFGEMTLFEKAPRSARAQASGETVLLSLGRKELQAWLKSNPELAVGFFTELTQVLSRRLRRSSSELTLLFDLSRWLLEPIANSKELLQKTLQYLLPYLEGSWSAGAFLYNEFNNETELIAEAGGFHQMTEKSPVRLSSHTDNAWLDDKTYLVTLPGKKQSRGTLVFRSATSLSAQEQTEIGRTLTTVARLIASGLENIDFRSEESLRARLSSSRHSVL